MATVQLWFYRLRGDCGVVMWPGVATPTRRPALAVQLSGIVLPLLILLITVGIAAAPLAALPLGSDEAASLAAGARLFEAHCVGCHANGGNVIRRGRTLKLAALERAELASPEAIARIASVGFGQMDGYGSVLGPEGPEQVGAWVWQQALAGWPRTARPRTDES